jgi:hypothetical protein
VTGEAFSPPVERVAKRGGDEIYFTRLHVTCRWVTRCLSDGAEAEYEVEFNGFPTDAMVREGAEASVALARSMEVYPA